MYKFRLKKGAEPREVWRVRVAYLQADWGEVFEALVEYWGEGSRIMFYSDRSPAPIALFKLRQRYWTAAELWSLREPAMSFLRKAAASQAARRSEPSAFAKQVNEKLPAIREYLETNRWPNGDERITSTLTVYCDDGVYKVCLNDRQEGQSLWVASECLWDALETLEGALQGGTAEWRKNTFQGAKGGQKKGRK